MVAGSRFSRGGIWRPGANCRRYSKKVNQVNWLFAEGEISPPLALCSRFLFLLNLLIYSGCPEVRTRSAPPFPSKRCVLPAKSTVRTWRWRSGSSAVRTLPERSGRSSGLLRSSIRPLPQPTLCGRWCDWLREIPTEQSRMRRARWPLIPRNRVPTLLWPRLTTREGEYPRAEASTERAPRDAS